MLAEANKINGYRNFKLMFEGKKIMTYENKPYWFIWNIGLKDYPIVIRLYKIDEFVKEMKNRFIDIQFN